jgi:hypothetical protein
MKNEGEKIALQWRNQGQEHARGRRREERNSAFES